MPAATPVSILPHAAVVYFSLIFHMPLPYDTPFSLFHLPCHATPVLLRYAIATLIRRFMLLI